MTDPVTRRGNRFWFAAELGTALRWAAASGTPMSLITVDLARFNVLNTSLGPSTGDRVLRRAAADVASVLRCSGAPVLRCSDVLGRLGCDEFGILLPGADQRTALGHLPIDVLKIDKSFLDGIETGGRASRLLATVIAMGQGLGCTTLAEGIETPDQHQRLIELGCEHGQGFLLGRAGPGSVIEERTRTEVLAQVERPAG